MSNARFAIGLNTAVSPSLAAKIAQIKKKASSAGVEVCSSLSTGRHPASGTTASLNALKTASLPPNVHDADATAAIKAGQLGAEHAALAAPYLVESEADLIRKAPNLFVNHKTVLAPTITHPGQAVSTTSPQIQRSQTARDNIRGLSFNPGSLREDISTKDFLVARLFTLLKTLNITLESTAPEDTGSNTCTVDEFFKILLTRQANHVAGQVSKNKSITLKIRAGDEKFTSCEFDQWFNRIIQKCPGTVLPLINHLLVVPADSLTPSLRDSFLAGSTSAGVAATSLPQAKLPKPTFIIEGLDMDSPSDHLADRIIAIATDKAPKEPNPMATSQAFIDKP